MISDYFILSNYAKNDKIGEPCGRLLIYLLQRLSTSSINKIEG
jgi:hypothetical protein